MWGNKLRGVMIGLVLFRLSAPAQEARSTILGRVIDPTGAVIAGAAVEAANTDTGIRSTAQSNAIHQKERTMSNIQHVSTITSKGQITLPKPVRQALGVDSGGQVALAGASRGFSSLNR